MPFEFVIDVDAGVVRSEFIGDLTMADLDRYRDALLRHSNFAPHLHSVVDLRRVGHLAATDAEFRLFSTSSPFGDRARIAFMVSDEYSHGMARKFLLHLGRDNPEHCQIFWDADEVDRWFEP